jgi:hypothetical protein
MIIDDDEVLAYLEHYGVKGMQWGRRKARTSGGKKPDTRTPEQKSADRKETAFKVARAAVVIGVGGLLVKSIINQHQATKLGDIRRMQSNVDATKRLMDAQKGLKIDNLNRAFNAGKITREQGFKIGANIEKQAKVKTWKSERATLEALKKSTSRLNSEANGDLKKWYERSQTPLHLREYLSTGSDYSRQINTDAKEMLRGRAAVADARRKAAESLAPALKRNR